MIKQNKQEKTGIENIGAKKVKEKKRKKNRSNKCKIWHIKL